MVKFRSPFSDSIKKYPTILHFLCCLDFIEPFDISAISPVFSVRANSSCLFNKMADPVFKLYFYLVAIQQQPGNHLNFFWYI